jgi:thioredoxin-dependent peroxiredoxin
MTKLIHPPRIGLVLACGGLAAVAIGGCRDEVSSAAATPRPIEKAVEPAEGKLLPVGAEAPDFETTAHDGTRVRLSQMRGAPVVLYFYPKDETPGCTAEAEAFRDESAALLRVGARVVGVSLDTIESHREFAKNHDLTFPLVADAGGAIAAKYGVSTRNGFAERVTFIITPSGTIGRVFPEVRVSGHAAEVLLALGEVAKQAGATPAAR